MIRKINEPMCLFPIPEYISQRDTTCVPNSCKCSNGVGKSACECPIEAVNDCQNCDLGYNLKIGVQNTCVENKCFCTRVA